MDRLHEILVRVKVPRLRNLNLILEIQRQILHENAVARREESQNMFNKVLGILIQLLPILHVLGQIQLLYSPENCNGLLGHLHNIRVFNGEKHMAPRIRRQKRLLYLGLDVNSSRTYFT